MQTSDGDGEPVKVTKKKKKRKRRSSSNDESDEDAKKHRSRRRHSKRTHSDRRDPDGDREDGEISEDDDGSDEVPPEKEKHRSRHGGAADNATIEILDSTDSSMDSEQSFSNGRIQGIFGLTGLMLDRIRADFIAHTFSCRR